MNSAGRLLLGSVAINLVLLAAFALKPALLPREVRGLLSRAAASTARRSDGDEAKARPLVPPVQTHDRAAATDFWSALDSNDLPTFVRNLRAAGFSDAMVREMAWVRIDAIVKARAHGEAQQAADAPFWKPAPVTLGSGDTSAFYGEPSRLFREVLPPDLAETRPVRPLPLGELPAAKAEAIARIDRDYAELREKIRSASKGVELTEDREKGVLLQRARRADIVAALSPEELEIYDLSTWPLKRRVAESLSLMNGTEDEFVKIFRIYRPFSEILDPLVRTPDSAQQRTEAERQMAEQLKGALGESRYAEYLRSSNREFQDLDRLAAHEDLPAETAIAVFNLRSGAVSESRRIYDDPNKSVPQKRAALQALAGEIKTRIATMLGTTAAEEYVERAGWLAQMERGGTVSLDANGNVSAWHLPAKDGPRLPE